MTVQVNVHASTHDYPVLIGDGLFASLGALLVQQGLRGQVALVSDENVLRHWQAPVVSGLEKAGLRVSVFPILAGEEHKTLRQAEPLYGKLIQGGYTRADTLVALGGGVVGDLGGFVAATFHRGMPLVQVPTTLLAQVDSSIGGKVAVDHPLGKNLIGAFYPPRLVVVDTHALSSLPSRERWGGLAEVVKAGLIADAELVSQLETFLEEIGGGAVKREAVERIVSRAVEIKAEIVSKDEKEQGPRLHLNFGHTLGHALEAATGYGALTHGEAVVIGMRAAVQLSWRLGTLSQKAMERALALLARFPRPPQRPVPPAREAIRDAFARDKKAVAKGVRFIVLEEIGRASVVPALPEALIEEGIDRVLAEL